MVDPYRIDFEAINMNSQGHIVNLGEADPKENRNASVHAHEYVVLLKLHHVIADGKSAADLMQHQ